MIVRGRKSGVELERFFEMRNCFGLSAGGGQQKSDFIFDFRGCGVECGGFFEGMEGGRGIASGSRRAGLANPLGGGFRGAEETECQCRA
jgi:hypothetical protein